MWFNIILIGITILFVITLVIKRFAYFRPSYEFLPVIDNFTDIYEGNLHAWYKKGSTGKVILFCHGNAGNISHRQNKIIELSKMGHSVLIFDYSGFGKSRGIPNEQLCFGNASMFVELLLREGYQKENIIAYGESLGAAVASYIACRYNLSKLILESGLPGIRQLLKSWKPIMSIFGIIFCEFDTTYYLSQYKGQTLILHSIHDEVIPYSVTEEMRKYGTVIQMTGGHNNPNIPWNKIEEFIK
jgi:pimeloyl-ACP methyl ester carboxylesterase